MNRIKLPRVNKSLPYTTGDAQTWTYQYTWEDWQAVIEDPSSDWYTNYAALCMFLIDYFIEHPELVQEYKDFKNYTMDQIRVHMKNLKKSQFYTDERISALCELWDDMVSCVNQKKES